MPPGMTRTTGSTKCRGAWLLCLFSFSMQIRMRIGTIVLHTLAEIALHACLNRSNKRGIVNLQNSVVEISPFVPHFADDSVENDH